jgi:hypothetical protein
MKVFKSVDDAMATIGQELGVSRGGHRSESY